MCMNAGDSGDRVFILVQLPEPLDSSKAEQRVAAEFCDSIGRPRTPAELTMERLRRAAKQLELEHGRAVDHGFRGFRPDSSNIREWEGKAGKLGEKLQASIEYLKTDRSEADILCEVLLKLGLDLCVPIERRTSAGKEVHSVGGGVLIACLAPVRSL